MTLDLSPLSSCLPQPRDLPWESLIHIFSYCDQTTLAAVSLVSFGCWELAGPILYQDVEVVDLDGLASLFFLETFPASPRLQQATSLLSRIKTLFINLRTWRQKSGPYFDRPAFSEETGDDFENVQLLPPLRLFAFTTTPLPLRILSINGDKFFEFFGWLGLQLFLHLNPTQVIHRSTERLTFPAWPVVCDSIPREFLLFWTDLRRVVWEGFKIVVTPLASSGVAYREDGLYALWVPPQGEEKRSLEFVFDTAKQGDWEGIGDGAKRSMGSLENILWRGGVDQQLSGELDLRVTFGVRQEDEKVAKERVAKLSAWTRKLVLVEVV